MKKQITKEITRVKKYIKIFAKQHNTQVFIDRVNPIQRMINDLFFEFMLEDALAFKTISYKQDEFNQFVDDCWQYCQGNKRIIL